MEKCWFGRCIFISWYCDVGTCKFCYRSTQKSRIKHAKHARRTKESMIVEAILAKNLGWRIEFLTGGYKIYPIEELVDIAKIISKVYGEKIWLNLGALKKEELELFKPYVKGVVASIETVNPELHKTICPDKNIEDYEEMLKIEGFMKSMTIVVGLGEKREDFPLLKEFIQKYKLDRITFYALKPVPGTPYEEGPSTEDYCYWISETRKAFPELEIIAGTTARRVGEVSKVLEAGANAITKFPATKKFNSEEARVLEAEVAKAGREFVSTLTKLPDIDWAKEVDKLDIENKEEVKKKLFLYLDKMST
ncbi:radical SAM protein [archaeon]|jgi:biotin synthase-like enzyme|nr:radical SAM protein [archaeon]MBT4397778.1 radical SAM protein [archaeon]MBT4441112.1 radical SAM protein [archaeon]